MKLDPEKVWLNARKAATADLLDRVTAYRQGMEPEAIAIIEAELRDRGISQQEIRERAAACAEGCINLPDGTAARCSRCGRPAVAQGWGWHRLWGKLPVFPRWFYYCREHQAG